MASSIPKPGESLADLYPDLVAQWHPAKNDALPSSVKPGSHRRVWWSCTVAADHEWEAPVKRRAGGSKCPFCAGQRPSSTNNFAYHEPAPPESGLSCIRQAEIKLTAVVLTEFLGRRSYDQCSTMYVARFWPLSSSVWLPARIQNTGSFLPPAGDRPNLGLGDRRTFI